MLWLIKVFFPFVITFIFLFSPSPDSSGVAVSSLPYKAEKPGLYYLVEDVSVPVDQPGFQVATDEGVTFDLKGHTITCEGGPSKMTNGVIAQEHKNFTLTNGTIKNCTYGFNGTGNYLELEKYIVKDMVFLDNYFRGIRSDASNSRIYNNRIINTGGCTFYPDAYAMGIEVRGAEVFVYNNMVINTHGVGEGEGVGISCSDYGKESLIKNNFVVNRVKNELADYAIWVGGSSDPKVSDNTMVNFLHGLVASSTTKGFYQGNSAHNIDEPYKMVGDWEDGGNNLQ